MWKAYNLTDNDLVVLRYDYSVMFREGGRNFSVIPLARENFTYPECPPTGSLDLRREIYTVVKRQPFRPVRTNTHFQIELSSGY